MIRVHLKFKTQLARYLERTSKTWLRKDQEVIILTAGPEYNSRVDQRAGGTKTVGTAPTDFSNGRKETVGIPTVNGWGTVSVKVTRQ